MDLTLQNKDAAVTRLINLMGKDCKTEQVLREGIVNGIEANNRFLVENPTFDPSKLEVIVTRDWQYEHKLSIVNINGEYLSPEIALDHLATLANSGNERGATENYGIGAKVSYLPNNPLGIVYRSLDLDGESNWFHMMLQENGRYGLNPVRVGSGEWECFTETETSPLIKNCGTEMVLMGKDMEDSTWNSMVEATALGKLGKGAITTYTGGSIVRYLEERFWENMGSTIKVEEKSKGRTAYRRVEFLKDAMTSKKFKTSGVMDLKGIGVPKGTKVYYCQTSSKTTQKGMGLTTSRYFVSFAWRKENYFNRNAHHLSHIKCLKDCGLYAGYKEWVIVFELPEEYNASPALDRTTLRNLDENMFFEAFRNNLPKEIVHFLENRVDIKEESDIKSEIKALLSDMRPTGVPTLKGTVGLAEVIVPGDGDEKLKAKKGASGENSKVKGKIEGQSEGGKGTNPQPKPMGGKRKPTSQRTRGVKKLRAYQIPKIVQLDDGDAPLVEFHLPTYTMSYNINHPLWAYRWKRIMDKVKTKNISASVALSVMATYTLKNALRRVFEIQSVQGSIPSVQKEQMWSSHNLEACWSLDSELQAAKAIDRKMRN